MLFVVVAHTLAVFHKLQIGPANFEWMGALGVCLFFLHTSLVLMWSLDRRPHTLDFYIRRAFRIYPLAWAALFAVVLFHIPLVGTNADFFQWHDVGVKDVLSSALLFNNISHAKVVMGVMWTLPLEMQMYILLPVLFFFVQKNKVLWPLLLIWTLTVLYNRFHWTGEFNVLQAAPLFLSGVIAYVGFKRTIPRLPAWAFYLMLAAVSAVFLYRPSYQHSWYLILLVGLALPYFRQMRVPWLQVASHRVAKYSYGLYLSHTIALVIGVHLIHAAVWVQLSAAFVSMCAMSYFGYHWIEKPMINRGAKQAAKLEVKYEKVLARPQMEASIL